MNRKYFLIIVAAALLCLIIIFFSMRGESDETVPQSELATHPVSPFQSSIFGLGVIESSSENIAIGAPVNRIVESIPAKTGSKVQKGEILIRFENRDLEANLVIEQLKYDGAVADVQKLEALPRKEDLVSAESLFKNADIQLREAQSEYQRVQSLSDPKALSAEQIDRRKYNVEEAQSKWEEAKANLDKVKAGTWQPDLKIAELAVLQAKASVESTKVDIERTIVRSPLDGTVLQINIHEGEMPSTSFARTPIMIVGDIDILHLRVNINQFEAPYYDPKSEAVAFLQGDARVKYDIEFIEIEPYLINKSELSNDVTEKVDTRVLQAIYRFKKQDHRLYVGEQMDVFIKTEFPEVKKDA